MRLKTLQYMFLLNTFLSILLSLIGGQLESFVNLSAAAYILYTIKQVERGSEL